MKHRIACTGIVVLASAGTIASGRAPRPEGCEVSAIECTNIPYLGTGQTWIPTTLRWAPNRLPAALISFRTGAYCSGTDGNYRGLQGWWYDQDDDPDYTGEDSSVLDNLRDRIADAYGSGYRRIILNLPAGTVRTQDFSSSQWWPMPQWKRDGLACVILNWLADHADTQFEVYAGFPIDDPESLCMGSNAYSVPSIDAGACGNMSTDGYMYYPCAAAATAHSPSPFAQADVCDFHRNIDPWQYLGITRYWLDGSTAHWSDFSELPYCPLYAPGSGQPHFLGAEAFPMIFNSPDPDEIDFDRAVLCPAIMFPGHIAAEDPDKSWDASVYAQSTELMVIVDYTDAAYFNLTSMFDVLEWTQRGFVLAAQATENAFVPAEFTEFMKRVYDFGTLANRRDFNGDGVVDSQDATDFNAAYALYHGKSNCNWVHGDMDGDHDVDAHDAQLFNLWHTFQTQTVQVNLGTANPDNALTKP